MQKPTFFITLIFLIIIYSPHLVLGQEVVELDLESAIEYALAHSSTVKMAEHTVKQAEAKIKEARADFLPQVNVGLNYVDSGANPMSDLMEMMIPGYEGKETPYMASIDLKQNIFASPAWLNYKVAEQTLYYHNLQYEESRENLAFAVTNSYYEAIKTTKLVKIAESSLEQAQRNLAISQAHYKAGMITKNQVLQMELAVAQARQSLLQTENGYQMSLAAFKNTIGMDQDLEVRLVEETGFSELLFVEQEMPTNEEMLLTNRLDLKATKVSVDMAEFGVKMAASGYYPVAYLSIQSAQSGADGFAFDDPSNTITLGVSWSLPLNGKTKASVQAAQEGLSHAEEGLKMAVQGAKLEIKQAGLTLAEAKQRTELTALALEVAEENALLATKRFEVGVGTAQEVNEPQVALEQARVNALNAQYDLFLSGLHYQKALGKYEIND